MAHDICYAKSPFSYVADVSPSVTGITASPPVGGAVGIRKAGVVQVCRQACRDLQWRKQTQALHCHCFDWIPPTNLSGTKF